MKQKQIETEPMRFDGLKWVVVAMLLVTGVVANSYYAATPITIRLIAGLLLFCTTVLIASFTGKGRRAWSFAREARIEMQKVVWPTRQEIVQTTGIVIVMVVVMGLLLWGIDSVVLWLISFVTGQRG